MIKNKVCSKCHKGKPATAEFFYRNKNMRDKLQCWCRSCKVIADKEYHQRPEIKAANRARQKQYAQTPAGRKSQHKSTAKYQRTPAGKESQRKYCRTPAGKETRRKSSIKGHNTLRGYLGCVFHGLNRRCNNTMSEVYEYYGDRDIELRFTLNEFRDYVINVLGITTFDQIKGLQIHRINNNSHYMPVNIEFLTPKQHAAAHARLRKKRTA